MPSPHTIPACCSEACFKERLFAPFQLPELSVQDRFPLLFSSSRLNIVNIVSMIPFHVNRHS